MASPSETSRNRGSVQRSAVVVIRGDGGDDAQQQQSRNDEASVGRSGLLVNDNRLDFNDRGNIATGESGRSRQAQGQGEGSEFGHDHAPFSTLTAAVSGNIAETVA